jgi:hypothetical protein
LGRGLDSDAELLTLSVIECRIDTRKSAPTVCDHLLEAVLDGLTINPGRQAR